MSRDEEHAKFQAYALSRMEQAMGVFKRGGLGIDRPSYLNLERGLSSYRLNIGLRIPRPITFLMKLVGLSPGEITVWHDGESGFFTEARALPGALPVYHHVSDEVALTLLKGELTHELEAVLMTPDDYLGE